MRNVRHNNLFQWTLRGKPYFILAAGCLAEQVVVSHISHFFSPFRKKFSTALISMINRNNTSAMENKA